MVKKVTEVIPVKEIEETTTTTTTTTKSPKKASQKKKVSNKYGSYVDEDKVEVPKRKVKYSRIFDVYVVRHGEPINIEDHDTVCRTEWTPRAVAREACVKDLENQKKVTGRRDVFVRERGINNLKVYGYVVRRRRVDEKDVKKVQFPGKSDTPATFNFDIKVVSGRINKEHLRSFKQQHLRRQGATETEIESVPLDNTEQKTDDSDSEPEEDAPEPKPRPVRVKKTDDTQDVEEDEVSDAGKSKSKTKTKVTKTKSKKKEADSEIDEVSEDEKKVKKVKETKSAKSKDTPKKKESKPKETKEIKESKTKAKETKPKQKKKTKKEETEEEVVVEEEEEEEEE